MNLLQELKKLDKSNWIEELPHLASLEDEYGNTIAHAAASLPKGVERLRYLLKLAYHDPQLLKKTNFIGVSAADTIGLETI